MANGIKVMKREPLTIRAGEIEVSINKNLISVFCKRHDKSFRFSFTPVMGVSTKPYLVSLKTNKDIAEATFISISDEFSARLYLTMCSTGTLVLTSKIRPIRRLISLDIITPHLRIDLKNYKWHIKSSLSAENLTSLEGNILPIETPRLIVLNNKNCNFSFFAGRCLTFIKNKFTLLYPRLYIKQKKSLLSLGLQYCNLPNVSIFETCSSLAIHHIPCNVGKTVKSVVEEEKVFADIGFNIADALEPIKVAMYQKAIDDPAYICTLIRALNELRKHCSLISFKLPRITLVELIEMVNVLFDKSFYTLNEGVELIKRYLGKIMQKEAINDKILCYIKGIIKRDENIIVSLAESIANSLIDQNKTYNMTNFLVMLEVMPLITYPPSHISLEVSLKTFSKFKDIIPHIERSIFSDFESKSTRLGLLALQFYTGVLLREHAFKVKEDVKDYIKILMKIWDTLDDCLKLMLAGFSSIVQYKNPKIFPLIDNFRVVYLPPFRQNTRIFLINPKGSHELIKFYAMPVNKIKIRILNEFGELLYEVKRRLLSGGVFDLYLPIEESNYFTLEMILF